ncbi:DUF3175 domain-containing protein [Niabella soli]|uniref:Uncharacterized protein n=1 Tax=Niabella soli DSM 19437 TaxID=929713 RepID=W0F2W6_9BACT|nr:DUF3175 domain-containing protein [Niabella soli]AHF17362.1 hypothetical protein NIASO_06130 [Niabella soli DSM 19437]
MKPKSTSAKRGTGKWSKRVNKTSNALDLEPDIFKSEPNIRELRKQPRGYWFRY